MYYTTMDLIQIKKKLRNPRTVYKIFECSCEDCICLTLSFMIVDCSLQCEMVESYEIIKSFIRNRHQFSSAAIKLGQNE